MLRSTRWPLTVACFAVCFGLATSPVQAQFGFSDNFLDDPLASGDWVFNGVALWVPPPGDADLCLDPNAPDPFLPCSVYSETDVEDLGETIDDFGGYILVTPGINQQAGNAFRAEPDSYDNFKMEVVVELRNGSIGLPADGMVIVVVGSDGPPMDTGTGGGGMGAPCVGDPDTAPILAWEFDDWSCNTGDSTNDNHLAFSYSPTGFSCADAAPPDVFVPIDKALGDFHNQQDFNAGPVEPNRYRMTVFAQNCGGSLTVATDLEALDFNGGFDFGRIFTHVVPDFVPFDGFLGVTASTGDANQNHILHSATLEELPDGFCLQPAAQAARAVAPVSANPDSCGDFEPGGDMTVTLTVSGIRQANDCCDAATSVTVTDTVPVGWTAASPSDGGTVNGRTVTWTLSGGNLTEGKQVSYTATAPAVVNTPTVAWGGGETTEPGGGIPIRTSGVQSVSVDSPFDACGRIRCWNTLGAFLQAGGAAPLVDAMRGDFLTDGATTETSFNWQPGEEIAPDFFGTSAADGLFLDPNNRNPNAIDGVATVYTHKDSDGWINQNDDIYAGNPDNVMGYLQLYITAEEEQEVFIASDSDDSIQILLNGEEVWINSFARGNDEPCPGGLVPNPRAQLRDLTVDPVILLEGEKANNLIVKTFEGGGAWNAELRFENDLAEPVTEGISISYTPPPGCRIPPATLTRTVDTGRTLGGQPTWLRADIGSANYDVSIAISDLRTAAGDCPAAGQITIVETVPAGWTPSGASNGGTIGAGQVSWTVNANAVATLTYQVAPGGTLTDASFSASAADDVASGYPSPFGVGGTRTVLYEPAPFTKGTPEVAISEDFDDFDEAECPAGWDCNRSGTGVFTVGVTQAPGHEGRLRLTPQVMDVGATVNWSEPIDVSERCLTAEFDVYLTHDPLTAPAPGQPADGLTFMLLDADVETSFSVGAAAGGGLAVDGLTGIMVELDTWSANAQEPSGYNTALAYGHVAVIKDGVITPHVQTQIDLDPLLLPQSFGGDGFPVAVDQTGDGIPLHFEVEYNNGNVKVWLEAPETNDGLEPAFPRTLVLDTFVTYPSKLDAGADEPVLQEVIVGFSGATGGAVADHEVDDVTVTVFDQGPGGGVVFRRGDVDAVGAILLTDGVYLLNFLFLGGPEPSCYDAADVNDDGRLDITTAVYLFNFLFLGGPVPPSPGTAVCGPDLTDDTLDCVSYDNCP